MCGISGWVDFDRDLSGERQILEVMNRTMACRGPDASGLWLASHAALGHRRLAVIDLEGGRDVFRELLAAVETPERSTYQGIDEVRPGQVVTIGRAGVTKRRYWQLEAIPHTDDLDTTVSTVRELLLDIVDRQLISDVPLCTLLSGGLDSSAVTAIAAAALAREGEGPVRSFAVDFRGYTENFTADVIRPTPD